MDAVLDGGFADPVLQSQSAFRAILDALANPGTLQSLVAPGPVASPLTPDLATVALTLADHDTSLWLDETLAGATSVLDFVSFHTGASLARDPAKATFALSTSAALLPRLDQFNLGTQEYPDRSTTVLLAVEALTGGSELIIRGPGIKDHGHIAPVGLPADFVAQWSANRELFPRGIDLLLVANGQLLGLPRSTRISGGH